MTNNQNLPTILVTGGSGLIGSNFIDAYSSNYQIINLSHDSQNAVDITDLDSLESVIQKYPQANSIIHLAAYTDVNGAFEQTNDKNGPAYQVNVVGTQNLIELAQSYNKFLIHISTAYVFNGHKKDPYLETDQPDPIEWYGQTKFWAETTYTKAFQTNNWRNWTILRLDQPFRSSPFAKKDVAHKIITGIQNNSLYPQFTNHWFGPTFIDDLAKIFDFVLQNPHLFQGEIFHASSGEQWTDYDFANLINTSLNLGGNIKSGDLNTYLASAQRPYQINTALNCDKLTKILDFKLTPIKEAVKTLRF